MHDILDIDALWDTGEGWWPKVKNCGLMVILLLLLLLLGAYSLYLDW
eukprot:SAG11_NODE_15345_length_581_cov_1.072614_1_plen_47_part_00